MRVLHIAGGFAQHPLYSQLVGQIHALGYDQTVFAPVRSNAELARQPADVPGAIDYKYRLILRPVHRVLFRSKIRRIFGELSSCVDPTEIDVVHAHTAYSDGAVALRMHRRFGVPYVVAVRNTDLNVFMRFRPDLRWILCAVLGRASKIVFLSPVYRSEFLSRLPRRLRCGIEAKSLVLGNGLDSFWLQRNVGTSHGESGSVRILYVGDFSHNKNVERILRAVALLDKRMSVRLTLVGGGGSGEKQILSALRKTEYSFANFVGRIEDRAELRSIYRAHDIFVMPSFKETFGVVYIEALSQGLPIVHSRGQGVDGFFAPGTVSEAVNPRSIDSIAAGIEHLAGRLESVRTACISEARRFSWESIAASYGELYDYVVRR